VTPVDNAQCNKVCDDDPSAYCGNGNRLTAFINPSWQPPLLTQLNVNNAPLLGCYACVRRLHRLRRCSPRCDSDLLDGTTRILNDASIDDDMTATVGTCVDFCVSRGLPFAGVEHRALAFRLA
jgi:hypothetical protein